MEVGFAERTCNTITVTITVELTTCQLPTDIAIGNDEHPRDIQQGVIASGYISTDYTSKPSDAGWGRPRRLVFVVGLGS